MARRRQFYPNPQLGASSLPEEPDRELAINQAAANQYQMMRKTGIVDPLAEDRSSTMQYNVELGRVALAKALGYKPEEAPSYGALMSRFYSLPKQVQAGIYRQGGAHFLGGADGAKLIQSVATDKEHELDNLTGVIGNQLASGKMQMETGPDGKPAFFSIQDDENDPTGMKKKKVPLNALQLSLLDRGFKKGLIPNPFAAAGSDTSGAPLPPAHVSTDNFQQVLNNRATGGDTASFQRVLDQRANPTPPMNTAALASMLGSIPQGMGTGGDPIANAATMSLSPYKYNSNMQLDAAEGGYAYDTPLQFMENRPAPPAPPAPDFFANAGRSARDLSNVLQTSAVRNRETFPSAAWQALKAVPAALGNIPIRASNAAFRFFGGEGGGEYGQIPLNVPESQLPAVPPALFPSVEREREYYPPLGY